MRRFQLLMIVLLSFMAINLSGQNANKNKAALSEGFEGGAIPTGWVNDSDWQVISWSYNTGSYGAYISSSGTHRLVSPLLSIDGTSTMDFYAKSASVGSAFKLAYSTDLTNWTDVPSGSVSLTESFAQYSIDLSVIGTGNYYIAFVYNLNLTSIYLDDVAGPEIVPEAPSAATNPTPADAATDIAISSDLTWENGAGGGEPTGYKVYFGTDGEGSTTPTNIENGTSQATQTYTPATSLEYGTTYYWQIVPTNSEGDAASCPIWSFTTEANPVQPIPYSEDFEAVADWGLPTNWSSNFTYSVKSDHGVSSSKGLSVLMWSSTSSAEAITTAVGPLSSTGNQIQFEYRIVNNSNYPNSPTALGASDKIDIKVSTDDGSTFTTVHTIDQSNHVSSSDFATTTINLDAVYNSETIKIKFLSTWGEGEYFVDIDNVEVREVAANPELLAGASELTFQNVPVSLAHTQTLNILNDGGGTLEITDGDITFTGTDAADFSLGTVTYPIQLGAGENIDLDVTYTASSAGSKSATMEIVNNGASGTASITLTASSYDLYTNYFQDFETTAADAMPEKWSKIDNGDGWAAVDDSDNAYESAKYLLMTSSTQISGDLIVATPGFEIGSSRLVFMAKRNNYVSTLSVGTMSDPTDATTFNEIQSIDLTETYTEYEVDFSSYSGTDVYVALKHNLENSYSSIFIDNVTWEDVPTTPICEVNTTNINWGDVTLNEVDTETFTITNAGVGTLTINDGDFTFSGTNSDEFSVDDVSYPIELAEEESAEVTLSFIPQSAGSHTGTLEITHNGNNSPTSITLEGSGYDGIVEDFNGAFPPDGWTADDAWKALTFSTYEGDGGAWFNPGSEVTEAKLISPKLTVENGDLFSFFAKKANEDAVLKVMYTEDTASRNWSELDTYTITNTDYEEKSTSLSLDGDYFIAIAGSGVAFTSAYVDFIKGPSVAGTYSTTFTVTDTETGDPVSGAEINIDEKVITTNASGLAYVELENGSYPYTITLAGYFDASGTITVDNNPVNENVSIDPITSFDVNFTVQEDGTADPIQGAVINIDGSTLTTDNSGLAAINLENGTYTYTVTATGYLDQSSSVTINGASEAVSVSLVPVSGYTVTFTVNDDATADPIDGATINIEGTNITTDASGMADIVLENGTFTYTVTATGYTDQTGSVTVNNANEDITVNLATIPTYDAIFAITDIETGNPIENATIDINGSTLNTDSDGNANIQLENGTYDYTINATDYIEETGSVTINNATETINAALSPVDEITATFNVTDEDGAAIESAEISINGTTITTDASGIASIALDDGTYEYTITANGYAPHTGEVTISGEDAEVNVTLTSVYELTFVVNNEAGDPIEGAFVVIGENFFTTDANGQITVEALNGTYYYTVTKADYEMVSGEVTVDGADVTENVTLRLVYFVYFTVNDEDDNPIEGATVTVEDSTLTTTASGETQIELPNGTYQVSISKDGYETVSDEFTVQNAGLDISVTLPMVQNDYTVTFNVTNDEANVLDGAEVSFTDGTDTWTAVTDADGLATFNNIVNGDYDYTVTKTDYETATGSLTVADSDVTTDVEMAPVGIANTTPANFNMYPNPTKGIVNIQFEGTYNIMVLNSVGQVVLTNKKHNNATIDLTNQADGIYFIRIQNATNLFSKQVVVE